MKKRERLLWPATSGGPSNDDAFLPGEAFLPDPNTEAAKAAAAAASVREVRLAPYGGGSPRQGSWRRCASYQLSSAARKATCSPGGSAQSSMSAMAAALLRPAPPWDRPALTFSDRTLSALIAGWAAAALSRLPVELLAGRLSVVVVVSVLPAVAPSPRLAEDDIARGSTKD